MPKVLKTTGLRIPIPASRYLPKMIFGNARFVYKPSTDQAFLRTATVERRSEYVQALNLMWKDPDEGGKGMAPALPASAACVSDGYAKVYKRKYIAPGKYIENYKACPAPIFFKYLSEVGKEVAEKRPEEKKAKPVDKEKSIIDVREKEGKVTDITKSLVAAAKERIKKK